LTDLDRRSFLKRGGALTAGTLTLGGPMQALLARSALAAGSTGVAPDNSGYGPLRPTRDIITGEVLLELPEGFLYRSFGRTGEVMSDGVPTPGSTTAWPPSSTVPRVSSAWSATTSGAAVAPSAT
jgi:hypothetical protein